jgi:signal transduction histidine kinase
MQMKHIGMKLFLGFISMAIMTIVVLWIVQAGFMRNYYLNQRMDEVKREIRQASVNDTIDYDILAQNLNVSLIATDDAGTVVYRSQGLPMMMMMVDSAQSMIPAEMDGTPHFVRSRPGEPRYALVGQKLPGGGYLFAVFSMADLDGASQMMRQQLRFITILLVGLSVLLAIFLSGKMSRPIRAVTAAARDLASGKYDVRLPVQSKDEIGQLTEALNDLGVELGRTENLRHELIANVSHELRSPLTVIQGYAETIRDVTWPDASKRTEQLNIIADESSRLTRVVKDILDYSRLQAGMERLERISFPLYPVFEQLVKQFEIEAGQHYVSIQMHCPSVTVTFDRDRLDQVMHNLLHNAINHAKPNSVIDITASQPDVSGVCRIAVQNQGNPIPPESLPQIWDRYYRADQMDNGRPLGTGLGLAIVKSILDRHAVQYGVLSENEQTTFWFDTCGTEVTD